MRRVTAVILATVVLMCAAFVAVAIAHTVKYDSTVTIQLKKNGNAPDSFAGKVISTHQRCEMNRTVKVFQRSGGATNLRLGTDQTDTSGNWELQLPGAAAPGTYYAVATREVLRKTANHLHVCRKAVSNDLTIKH